MPRIVGRKIYPTDSAERLVLAQLGLGTDEYLRIPRRLNPYALARGIDRAAHHGGEVVRLAVVLQRAKNRGQSSGEVMSTLPATEDRGDPDEAADDAA